MAYRTSRKSSRSRGSYGNARRRSGSYQRRSVGGSRRRRSASDRTVRIVIQQPQAAPALPFGLTMGNPSKKGPQF